jgi:hypothetical protein
MFHPVKVKAIQPSTATSIWLPVAPRGTNGQEPAVFSDSAWLLGRYLHAMKHESDLSVRFQEVEARAN